MDDEPGVLAITSRILRKGGYEVVEARDAAEALALVSSPELSFDLLLTDSVMPGMSGAGLAERVAGIRPGMRVLHMPGYAVAQASLEQLGREGTAVIEKPFTAGALLEKVRSVLSARPTE